MTFDPFYFVLQVWEKFVDLVETLYNFLFYQIQILGNSVSVWQLLGGAGLIALIVWAIIRG